MSIFKQPAARYVALICSVILVVLHHLNMKHEHEIARAYHAESSAAEAKVVAEKVEATFSTLYKNLKIIATLPAVMDLDLSGLKPDSNGAQTVRQLHENLFQSGLVSTLYITPNRIGSGFANARSGALPKPVLAQDQLKSPLQAQPTDAPQLRTAEYRQISKHLSWLTTNVPSRSALKGDVIPMLGSSAVELQRRNNAEPQQAVFFSLPIYTKSGVLNGTVTAVLPHSALSGLVPAQNYALVNTHYKVALYPGNKGQQVASQRWVRIGAADPKLIASSVNTIRNYDPRSTWQLWMGLSDSVFHEGVAATTLSLFEIGGYIGLVLLMMLLLFIQWLEAARMKTQRAEEAMARTREAHLKALEAEQRARTLNLELEANLKILSETQKELLKHERLAALGQVTATLSHEIRNPLGAIRSSLYVIRQTTEKAELKLDRPLDRIARSVTRCDNLIDDFLEYTRTHDVAIQIVDASQYINALLDDQALPEDITLTRDFPRDGTRIGIDPDRFRRVVINLVENAAQAIKETQAPGGEINVSYETQAQATIIRVRDNGPGIPDAVMEKIFEPLFTTKSFGAGLGLPTVKQLVEQHGAELKIDTEVGVGTTFSIVLPHPGPVALTGQEIEIEEKAA